MSDHQPTPEQILQLATGGWRAGILGAAVTHSMFAHIQNGEDTAHKLAKRAGLSERGTQTILDGLVALGMIDLYDGTYRNTAESSAFLIEGGPAYIGGFAKVLLQEIGDWSSLPEVARTGIPVVDATFDVPENPFWNELVPAIAPFAAPVAMAAAEKLRLAEAGEISILDVGGGSGIYSAIWLGLNPAARSTQLDWAPVNATARRLLAERGVIDRFTCIDGDFHTTGFGVAAYDVGVYSGIAHQEGPQDNVAIFTKFRDALKPGGTLVISDLVVNNDRSGPPFALIFAADMLLKSKYGGTWRRADYEDWLAEAGFTDVSFQATPSPNTLVFAR
jgi:O-methyltransferase domain/Dimerisation domain